MLHLDTVLSLFVDVFGFKPNALQLKVLELIKLNELDVRKTS